MLSELIEAIKDFSPYLSAILAVNNPISSKIIETIAHYFEADPSETSDIVRKIEADSAKEHKLIEIEAKYKDFGIKIKIGNDD